MPSPYGATPPHPGAGRETHRKILPERDAGCSMPSAKLGSSSRLLAARWSPASLGTVR